LVVSDLGWFAELPDDVALKVPVGDGEEGAIASALAGLADPEVAESMGEAARAYVRAEHELGRVAERYTAALEQAAGAHTVEEKILRAVAAAAADTGVQPAALAPDLVELGLVGSNGHVQVPDPGLAPGRGLRRDAFAGRPIVLWLLSL